MVKRFFLFAPVVLTALLFAAVILAEGSEPEPGASVSTLARTVTIVCLLASVIAGVVPDKTEVRVNASIVFATLALTAFGVSRMAETPGLLYRAGCLLYVFVVLATFRMRHRWARTAAAQRPVHTKGRARPMIVLVVAWAAMGTLLVTQLPRASRAVERRVQRYFEGAQLDPDNDRSGFSSNLHLGSTRAMLKSTAVVMRLEGERVDYLRGAVLDEYDARHQRWSASLDEARVEVPAATPREGTTTHIRIARSARVAHGAEARWFLPADACDLRSESGHVKVDRTSVVHPDPSTLANEISFRSGASCQEPGAARLSAPQGPGPLDVALTPELQARLAPIALRWTAGLTNDRAKLDAIALKLESFGYSLDVKRTRGVDAVIDLLTIHREGHCELFATAMALLARTQGIPTRLVSGYRVTEINPITGLAVVRESNAHTWVEAWVDGRWAMWDPTPMNEAMRPQTTGWGHTTEALAWAGDRAVTTFWEIGLARIGFGAGAIAVVLLIVRRFMQRRAKGGETDLFVTARPLPAFETLASALERAGWVRTASEPLERFADRVVDGGEPWSKDVANALVHYAELRYGGIGEEQTIAERLTDLAQRIQPLSGA